MLIKDFIYDISVIYSELIIVQPVIPLVSIML